MLLCLGVHASILCRQVCMQKRLLPTHPKAMITNALHQKVQGAGKIAKQIFRAMHLHFVTYNTLTAQAPNASTNGGRRVPRRAFFSNLVPRRESKQRLTDKRVITAVCEPFLVYGHCSFPRRDASPPFEVAFFFAARFSVSPYSNNLRKLMPSVSAQKRLANLTVCQPPNI